MTLHRVEGPGRRPTTGWMRRVLGAVQVAGGLHAPELVAWRIATDGSRSGEPRAAA